MFIKRIQVEEGFLDGIDVHLVPGLNVIIGARGTGKTSLIELIRFCLGAKSHTTESGRVALEHALSVLRSGQVTITLDSGGQDLVVSRTYEEDQPRATGTFNPPTIFSQTEIENVGLSPTGRLRLLDGFLVGRGKLHQTETAAKSRITSLTAEITVQQQQQFEVEQQLKRLTDVEARLQELTKREQAFAKQSVAGAAKSKKLDALAKLNSELAVTVSYLSRFRERVSTWKAGVDDLLRTQEPDPAPLKDPAAVSRGQFEKAKQHLSSAQSALLQAEQSTADLLANTNAQKVKLDAEARQLRKEIETLQEGAGAIAREIAKLREQKAKLQDLQNVFTARKVRLQELIVLRENALDALDQVRERRFADRKTIADKLTDSLAPRIKVDVVRGGQVEEYTAAITAALRGSGLRYNELAPQLAEKMSPRELLECVEGQDFDLLADVLEIGRDRAARVLASLREQNLGELATVTVEDDVNLKLLDGPDYKDIADLSTGQRCTVILPIVLEHKNRVIVVDQPEDHIDNAFIADTVVKVISERTPASQMIFSTHNPNIPVLGNADRVIQMGSDGRRGFVLVEAALEEDAAVTAITRIMEGGEEAFKKRASFYADHAD